MTERETRSGRAGAFSMARTGSPQADSGQALRKRAEAIARGKSAQTRVNFDVQSPEEAQRALHELRVHQIELEMQNDELRRTQEELNASRARYFDLYDLAPVGYFTISERGLILEANLTATTLLGVARGALAKQRLSRFIVHDDEDIHYGHRKQLFETGTPQVYELRLMKKDASHFWARVEATAAQDADGARVFRAVISDITERKRAEDEISDLNKELERRNTELMAVNKELESFSYSVSHDLRAPLRAIDGFSLALLEDCEHKLELEEKEHLGRIRAATEHMGRLIDDLLNLARTARYELVRGQVDLSALAREILSELQKAEPERRVTSMIAPDLIVEGDRTLLRVVLENLLANAWKFTSKQPDAHVEFGMQDEGVRTVYFVRDNGAGFDMKYADKLFGAFQRLHDESEFPGSGIGLATVQRIVHRHGGGVWAESAVGEGATFYFVVGAGGESRASVNVPRGREALSEKRGG
jgi:PAS domain S-box-containing protein